MKKAIILFALMAFVSTVFSQVKHENTKVKKSIIVKKDSVKSDTVKVDPNLRVTIPKQIAVEILKGLEANNKALPESEEISSKAASKAYRTNDFLMKAIYKKWPDLIPK